jgi:hypothetical protein
MERTETLANGAEFPAIAEGLGQVTAGKSAATMTRVGGGKDSYNA